MAHSVYRIMVEHNQLACTLAGALCILFAIIRGNLEAIQITIIQGPPGLKHYCQHLK